MTAWVVEDTAGRSVPSRAPVQIAALLVGGVFVLVGVLGFVPGVTTDFDQLTSAGHHSGAALMGFFTFSVWLDVVHLVFGVVGVWSARTFAAARSYLMGGGLVCLVLFFCGVVIGQDSAVNVVPFNDSDNRLHLGLAVGMLLLGAVLDGTAPHRGPLGASATAAPSIASRASGE